MKRSLAPAPPGFVPALAFSSAAMVAATLAGQTPADPAFVRHRWVIHDFAATARDPNQPHRSRTTENMTPGQREERLAAILRDLVADLQPGKLVPQQAYPTFEALGSMRHLARPAVPAIVAAIGTWDKDSFYRVPYYCSAVKSLGEIAPTSPEVIKVLSDALAAELPARGGVCHRCGCVLEALEQSGPAAREIAGPVLDRIMREPQFYTTYDWQLGRAVKAVGLGSSMRTALERARRPDVSPTDRADMLRALARETYSAGDRATLHAEVRALLADEQHEVRAAAAEVLHVAGAEAVPDLVRALGDWHFTVRVAAARSLGRLGPGASDAASALATAADPFLGTADAAAEALIAIGPGAITAIEARRAATPPPVTNVLAAVIRAVRERRIAPVRESLARDVTAGPHRQGYAHVQVVRAGTGRLPYDPGQHRITARYTVLRYPGPGRAPTRTADAIVAQHSTSMALQALAGRRSGDVVRLTLSPDIAQSPAYGTNRHAEHWQTHVTGTPGYFEIQIDRVCAPVIWTLFKGSGIWGPIQFEMYCSAG